MTTRDRRARRRQAALSAQHLVPAVHRDGADPAATAVAKGQIRIERHIPAQFADGRCAGRAPDGLRLPGPSHPTIVAAAAAAGFVPPGARPSRTTLPRPDAPPAHAPPPGLPRLPGRPAAGYRARPPRTSR